MQFLTSFTDRTPLFSRDLPVGELAAPFDLHRGASAFAVAAEDGALVGLIERTAVQRALKDGQGARPVGDLMLPDPLAIDAGCTLREALGLVLAHPTRPDAFVVVDKGTPVGVSSLRVLTQGLMAGEPLPSAEAAADGELQRLFRSAEIELRAHVQGLLAMTERLERQHLGPDALAQVHSIRATGESLLRLADDANDMLQARRGELQLELQPEPLRELMDRVQDRWAARAREAGVALLISYDGDPDLSARVDAPRLGQVFDALIGNALRYTRQGSIEAALRARVDGERVALEGRVRDTGPEAAAVRLAGLLDAGDPDSASLPLSLAQGILRSLGGAVRAESNAGQGMTVVFEWEAEAAGEAAARPEGKPLTGAPHVLVVDDNATNRMVAEALCEMFECTSETAEDGVEAVEQARTGRFDLILMDIKMPHMDGIAATKAIRALGGPASRVPVVALTANVDAEDARTYLAAGMCCVVEKPIKPDRLLQAINIALASLPPASGTESAVEAA